MRRKIHLPLILDPEHVTAGILPEGQSPAMFLESGALQNAIFNSANFSKIATDARGIIQIFNVGAERMLGYAAADVMNKSTPADISDPQELIARAKALSSELETPIASGFEALVFKASRGIEDIYELTYIRKDGSRFPALVSVTALRDAQDAIIGYLLIGTDNTARKHAEREMREKTADLARSNHDLEQFAYVASHDLQEPLRAVAGPLQLLQRRYQGQLDARADEYIGHAVEGAARMQALIEDLLTYCRTTRHENSIRITECGQALDQALGNLTTAIEETGAQVSRGQLPAVSAIASQLALLFQNLVGNAIKFRRKDIPVRIHVGAELQGDMWLFWVKDNGIGIDPQYLERIFLIFQRLHTRPEYPGTGIGLALCKRIVEHHGGRIWVESDPEKGTTFFFTLSGHVGDES